MIQNQAIKNTCNLCWKCLQKKKWIKQIEFKDLGYGSRLDGLSTHLQLCEDCINQTDKEWWNLEIKESNEYDRSYKYEKEILEYINSLPIPSQELFYNTYGKGSYNNSNLTPQEWINKKLDISANKIDKEYANYSVEILNENKIKIITCESGDWSILELNLGRDYSYTGHNIPDSEWIQLLVKLGYSVEQIKLSDEEMESIC